MHNDFKDNHIKIRTTDIDTAYRKTMQLILEFAEEYSDDDKERFAFIYSLCKNLMYSCEETLISMGGKVQTIDIRTKQ